MAAIAQSQKMEDFIVDVKMASRALPVIIYQVGEKPWYMQNDTDTLKSLYGNGLVVF